ncbi:hypothetical protein [Paracoccus yeei]|uniref:Uncharacterized protein n=1 Tax=Paracoccus yeei TaxID=147645 RepID=A0A5P2QU74_9RHOB|nr:hypothetical protein [Paracoccus yeei]QEU08929.1 hypothetical protein FOB51_13510 [Paracoccus yeei]
MLIELLACALRHLEDAGLHFLGGCLTCTDRIGLHVSTSKEHFYLPGLYKEVVKIPIGDPAAQYRKCG